MLTEAATTGGTRQVGEESLHQGKNRLANAGVLIVLNIVHVGIKEQRQGLRMKLSPRTLRSMKSWFEDRCTRGDTTTERIAMKTIVFASINIPQ